jgi:hypothetical protein
MSALNPNTVPTNAYDVWQDGNVSSFYFEVDEAITASDVIKGQYRMTFHPAYNAPNPVNSNSYTTIGLTQGGPMVVNLENSFITTEIDLQMKLDHPIYQDTMNATVKDRDGFDQVWFIGWKSSIEAIQRYDILVNSTPIYTQTFVGEESFIQYQTLSDLVKHSTPYIYTSYENASKMDPCVCGAYVLIKGQTFTDDGSGRTDKESLDTINVKIPIKIPITNFLILRDMKYLMSWMGKWEIRLFFSPQNLVVLPVHPRVVKKWWESYTKEPENASNINIAYWEGIVGIDATVKNDNGVGDNSAYNGVLKNANADRASAYEAYPEVEGWLAEYVEDDAKLRFRGHNRFRQFGDKIPICAHICNGKAHGDDGHDMQHNTGAGGCPWEKRRLRLEKMEMHDVEFIAAQFQIRMDVMEMIKSKYLSEKPLTFPVSTVQVSRFTGLPTMGNKVDPANPKPFTMVLCQAINNVDTIYVLPYKTHFQHTVCYQPWVEHFQLHAGEYGAYPVQPMHTFQNHGNRLNHMRYNNYISDALNVSSSKLVGFNRDLCYEFCPKTFLTSCLHLNPPAGIGQTGIETHEGKFKNHDDSNFFIALPFATEGDFQGGLSSPVSNINFKVQGVFHPPKQMKFSTPWVCLFLVDGVLMIRPDPMSDAAKVIWSDRTVI